MEEATGKQEIRDAESEVRKREGVDMMIQCIGIITENQAQNFNKKIPFTFIQIHSEVKCLEIRKKKLWRSK